MKKILSCFMALVLLICGVLPCFAASDKCNCGDTPIIYVAALGSGYVFLDKGTPSEKTLFRPQTEDILNDFAPLVPAVAQLLSDNDYDKFGDVLISCVNTSFGMLALDGEGKSHERVTSEEFHPENADHGIDYSYYFGYDFRLDPVENAEKLYTYIQEVKEITGHDTIRVRASSMGGVVMLSYMRLYGTADIETLIFQNCPLLGTAVAGELYNGKFEINGEALVRYAEDALPSMDSDFLAGFLYTLLNMLADAGLVDDLLGIADNLVLNLKDRVYDECLIPIFGTLPGIWSFVPDEYYEGAKEFMKLDENTQGVLIDKLDFYHYEVQGKAEELLKGAKASGTNVYILAGYNIQRTPLVTAYKNNSDGTVDTMYASAGGTCAYLGETLPEDYKQANYKDKKYISPDRVIDASTCILPENTWFVKDMLHCTCHEGHDDLYRLMHESEEQFTVFDYEEYPQFIQSDVINECFVPVGKSGTPLQNALWEASNMTSMFTIMQLIVTFFQEFYVWMVG